MLRPIVGSQHVSAKIIWLSKRLELATLESWVLLCDSSWQDHAGEPRRRAHQRIVESHSLRA